jgi:pimeloyl-ACP methyl ester carboxylesterase
VPTVRTNDIETYYERHGDGPVVVFVHGAILDHSQWDPQVQTLDDEYTTIVYDVRGHGRTGGSSRETYSIELFAEDLDALITGLDLEKPVLCGLSMGGCIAQLYAATYPEKVSGLVLVGTFTPDLSTVGERLQMALLRATILPARLVGYERVERVLVWLQERFQKGVSGDYENVEQLRARGPTIETAEFAKVIRALAAFPTAVVDYTAITAPTLVLHGEHEPAFIRRQSQLLTEYIADAVLSEIPDAGHASTLDDPAFVTSTVREFLQTVPRTAT